MPALGKAELPEAEISRSPNAAAGHSRAQPGTACPLRGLARAGTQPDTGTAGRGGTGRPALPWGTGARAELGRGHAVLGSCRHVLRGQQVPLGSTLLPSRLSDQWRNSDSNRRLCATGIPSGKKCRALTRFPLAEGPRVGSEAHAGSQNPAPDAIRCCRLARERCWDASQPLPAWAPAAQASPAPAREAPRWELLAAERAGVPGRAPRGCLPARLAPALARTRAGRQKRRARKNDELKAMETARRRHPVRAAARP